MKQITCLFCGTPYPETKPGTYTCPTCSATLTITPTSATQTAPGAEPKAYYTTAEVAELIHRDRVTIERKCRKHEIEAAKIGRGYLIPAHALREMLATTPPKPRKKKGTTTPELATWPTLELRTEDSPELTAEDLDRLFPPLDLDDLKAKGWPEL